MKAINDKIVSDHLWYLCLVYLNETTWKPIEDMGLMRYDSEGWPTFKLEWLNWEQFQKISRDAVEYFINDNKELTLDNIDKFVEK